MPGILMLFEALEKEINDYCSALSEAESLSGSVLVAYEGKIIFNRAYGMADIEKNVSNTPQTIFRIGSITKQFTAAIILRLQEMNLLQITDPIINYLPDYPNGEKITIHHLLNHSSGIPSFTSFIDYKKSMKLPTTLDDTIHAFKDLPLNFEPGGKFEYSNSGYLLLSQIIEVVMGRTFASSLEETILHVLGMSQSCQDNHRRVLKNRASGYEVWGEVLNAEYIDMSVPSGAGAMYSTTEDLFLWDQALHSNKILSKQSYESMVTAHQDTYGYGVFVYHEDINNVSRKVIGHGGGINGFASEYRRYVNEELTIIVLTNVVPATQPGFIANAIARITLGEKVELPERYAVIDMDYKQYESYAGEYRIHEEPGATIKVIIQDGKLYLSDDHWFMFEICPFSKHEDTVSFFIRGMQGKVVFTGDEVQVDLFGGTKRATKCGENV
ncbi:serine hydrolase domain-containing protein [Paenibacillus sp. Soil522]|uniref:serine hydrolase domain-containing protein n=1 Tax=Paenibacillus sp. Soil522 TaxID=1736388 RepID=UPI00070051FF|nr:serine hydrolase domain-containing protein [Paenibacillus sp. Soil522]KRE38745.1 hypothetical protein ASG81_19650 [Paenibacillus sp. Soil522]